MLSMPGARLDFRRGSYASRFVACVIIVGITLIVSSGAIWAVSSAYRSYDKYVNRPAYMTYTSRVGSITFKYPSSAVFDKRVDYPSSEYLTLSRSYNSNEATDGDQQGYNGLVSITVLDLSSEHCKWSSCRTLADEMERRMDVFRKAHFYDDPAEPDRLDEERARGYTINLVHDNRKIGGYPSEFYSVEQVGSGYLSGDYSKRVFALVPVGDILYIVEGEVTKYQHQDIVQDVTHIDRLIDSIKIGGSA